MTTSDPNTSASCLGLAEQFRLINQVDSDISAALIER
jgi:hypothetical protein